MKTYLTFVFAIVTHSSVLSYTPCSSSQILNIKDLSCNSCPTNQIPNPNQNIPTSCICDKGYYATTNHTCAQILSSGGNCSTTT